MTLSERLNFSDKKTGGSIKIDRRKDINYYETLCLYCADNDIDLDSIVDSDFNSAAMIFEEFGKLPRSLNSDTFYFWIDK